MNLDNQIPIVILHILEANIPQNTSIINEHIDPPKRLNGSLNNPLSILNAVVVCDRFAACSFDLVNDYVGGLSRQ